MRLLILGLGYSARHSLACLADEAATVTVTTRSAAKVARLVGQGLDAIAYDGSAPSPALAAAIGTASHILVSAGPDRDGDPFLRHHAGDVARAAAGGGLAWIGYYSTVGVYGDTGGAWVDDGTPANPASERTRWRVAAETAWTDLGAAGDVPVALLRLAGIYGPGRNAFINLAAGTARRVIRPGQVFNRIHVDDIATVTAAAARVRLGGPINVADDEPAPPQDPIAYAAGLMGVEPPPEIPFETAEMTPMAATFWGENKRVANRRLHEDLGLALTHPTYREGLAALWQSGHWAGGDEDREEASPRFRRIASP
ncbi:NAD(P)-dependent oxidoreductase [Prosthecodimorpha staleyi]|uniref:NAD(P)-dependent oxidoreductase n=1 Tax=Prosthecodimorpha staleyi TaxID=2840188 RepID=A0A947GE86_9HYPH|nr:NAD(P)-dependent oxidoreductase [Prosthecodimorpha staleyi]MBT9291632.1 NAD(P)-dependent oxidoreductase [Prosthecodimorpha staleyi]